MKDRWGKKGRWLSKYPDIVAKLINILDCINQNFVDPPYLRKSGITAHGKAGNAEQQAKSCHRRQVTRATFYTMLYGTAVIVCQWWSACVCALSYRGSYMWYSCSLIRSTYGLSIRLSVKGPIFSGCSGSKVDICRTMRWPLHQNWLSPYAALHIWTR